MAKKVAKKTPVKKSRRRLKRSVRRSLAAVLMITAIGVAAIPVPNSLAEEEDGAGGEAATPTIQYVDADKDSDYVTKANENTKNDYSADKFDVSKTTPDAIKQKGLNLTEVIINDNGQHYLTWQFLYEPIDARNGRLCQYNDQFKVNEVSLGLQPVESYYAVSYNDYCAYFGDEGVTADKASDGFKNDMDNFSSSSDPLYPTTPIILSYGNYNGADGLKNLSEDEIGFLNTYYPGTLGNFIEQCQKYDNEDLNAPPIDVTVSPSRLNSTDRLKFIVEHNNKLKGTGYELTEVIDWRLGESGKNSIWVAYSDETEESVFGYVQNNGYLVQMYQHFISTIGDKAFYEVNNVIQIEISTQVQYIGDSAFELSTISSVEIGNADTIGNRAFAECSNLTSVTFIGTGTTTIGAEAFRKSGINTKLSFPNTIRTIGHGAFSGCGRLSEVEFDINTDTLNLDLGKFAFYNDESLTSVNFGRSQVNTIGYGCFAIEQPSGDSMLEFSFPAEQLTTLEDYVLANRSRLEIVTIPNYASEIPKYTFLNCFALKEAHFADKSNRANFDKELFYYVTDPLFCVYGPELYGSDPASPRQSTWNAVRRSGVAIPYIYVGSDGRTYYEVAYESDDEYKTRYRYSASDSGELISCALIPPVENNGLVDIVIPSQIGPYSINSVGSTCFSDKELREKIRSVTIQNNSIGEIASGTFRDLPELTTVWIGNSVTVVGDNAFAGSKKLYDVYFAAGHTPLTLGSNVFATTGSQLTLHGDIVKGYAPFDYAADSTNTLKDPADTSSTPALNVCYQSLWNSAEGTHLTVMSDQEGNMTLLDYPKISDLNNTESDYELRSHREVMENLYYTNYDVGTRTVELYINSFDEETGKVLTSKTVDTLRREYALILDAKNNNKDSIIINDGETIYKDHFDDALEDRYGPWINPNYCGYWTSYLTTSNSEGNDLMGLLFKPIVARAAENPKPYFDEHPYDFMENYVKSLTEPAEYRPDYKSLTDEEKSYINATKNIIVPDGIDSIDVVTYSSECSTNYRAYISNSRSTVYMSGEHPGLFSGSDGNDDIESVRLTSVKALPEYAFYSCEQLKRVELGTLKKAGVLPFKDCPELIYLVGSDDCPAQNGILYEKLEDEQEGETAAYKIVECLLSRGRLGTGVEGLENPFISAESDSLISSVHEIADSAFADCTEISTINLRAAEELEIIPSDCFYGCKSLTSVEIGRNVTKIKEGAFGEIASVDHPLTVTILAREVDIADQAFEPKRNVTIVSYEDTAAWRYANRYASEGMRSGTLDAYRVMFFDYDGTPIGTIQIVDKESSGLYATEPPEAAALKEKDYRPGFIFAGWRTAGGKTLDDPITEDMTIFVAQYTSDGTMVNGSYVVEFRDGIDGRQLNNMYANRDDGKYYIEAGTSFMSNGWDVPEYRTHEGYKFLAWSDNWTENTVIDSNMTIISLYSVDTANGGGSSGVAGGSSGTTQTTSNTSTSSSTSSRSGSTTSTTSGSGTAVGKYTVTVENGSGSGSYDVGSTVIIAANTAPTGMVFQKWTTESNGVSLASVSMSATTFTMPANNVTVTANYVAGTATTAGTNSGNTRSTGTTGNTGNTGSTGTTNGTRVDITKPGISNKDLATANVNGSTDNFVVKIAETDEASRAVADALSIKYGNLENILYYAMDISLYDSTGTTKISDTTGLTVDITIPIPDALVAYGGNNMAGAVINGNQLEDLNESFTTINGVPCIRFTATHFSPYTVFVDTGNLTEGMLDITPKTGDPIHPKWFLSIGLACLSIILFMKKDKRVKVRTA